MKQRQASSSFRNFLRLSAFSFVVLAVALFFATDYIVRESFIRRVQQTISQQVTDEAVRLTPEIFTSEDRQALDSAFGAMLARLKTAEVIRIKVWDNQGKILYSDDQTIIGSRFPENTAFQQSIRGRVVSDIETPAKTENVSERAYERFLEVYVPVTFPGQPLPSGVIESYYRLDNLNNSVGGVRLGVSAAIVAFVIVSYLLLYVFFNRYVHRPVSDLQKAAEAIENGNLASRISIVSEDEIGKLAQSFNAMASRLESSYGSLEDKVRERTQFITKIMNAAQNLIYVQDANGVLTLVNKAYADLYGTDVETLIGARESDIRPNADESRRSESDIREVIETGKPKNIFEETFTARDGMVRWFHTIKVPFESGNNLLVLSVATDITDKMQAGARKKELDELKNTFIRIVSHQLRTPLGAIRWNLEELLSGDSGPLTDGQKELVRIADKADASVISRIGDLLSALDIEEQRMKVNIEKTDIVPITDSVVRELQPAADARSISLKFTTPGQPLPTVRADTAKIRDVIHKLTDNAVTYTPDGGTVQVTVSAAKDAVRFEVADTGIGIPAGEQGRMFERFYRASNAYGQLSDASGLGLFIAKNVVTACGGSIGFTSEERKGSTFWFELPVAA